MKNFRLTLAAIFSLFAGLAIAQTQTGPSKFAVYFTDKNNSPFTVNNPQQYLSQKAIDRRTRYNIAIDEKDLPVNQVYINGVVGTGAQVLIKSKWLNCVTVYVSDPAILAAIAALPYVQSVAPVALRKKSDDPFKNFVRDIPAKQRSKSTAKSGAQVPLDYGVAYNQAAMMKINIVHEQGFTGDGMTIAVLDAGFSNANTLDIFDSLFVNNRILGTRDFVNPNNTDVYQFNSHGTYVLSCMGGNIPGTYIGTAPHAKFWLVRTEEGASENLIEEYNWASGAEFADSVGADMINSSLGYTVFDDTTQSHTYADLNGDKTPATIAADVAASRGMLVCNSAGNSGTGAWFFIGSPADADSILTVGAVDSARVYANFSSKGPSADGRIKPNVVAQGKDTWVATLTGGVMKGNGTSFSSPVMAGAVACFWQAHYDHNNMTIIDAVQKSASQASNPDSLMGYGIPDFSNAALFLPSDTTDTTGIPELKPDEIINVFPNPFLSTFTILYRADKAKDIQVTVTDMQGKKVLGNTYAVKPGQVNNIVLSGLENAAKGQYVVTIKAGKEKYSKKMLKE